MAGEQAARHPYNVVLALAGPYGAGCSSLAQELERVINDWPGCRAERIRVSDLIEETCRRMSPDVSISRDAASPARRADLQREGTALRKKDPGAVANTVALRIFAAGESLEKDHQLDDVGTLFFIVDSLKNGHDVRTLRAIYGDEFFLLFVSADRETRWRRLKDYQGWQERNRTEFDRLDNIDNNEAVINPAAGVAGQQVGKLAVVADYYVVNGRNRDELHASGKRFVHLLIGNGRNQPTIHERSMHLAYSAALRSYCLSRQVGAAIIDAEGDVLGVGHNDVPKARGGLYTQEDPEDKRCYLTGDRRCINDTNKDERFRTLADELCKLSPEFAPYKDRVQKVVETSAFRDATEFCRAVHAEMEALLSCGRAGGRALVGGTMYVTTQPCHNCTKHILCAGLSRVVYIEPYDKSLAEELHSDAILINPPAADETVGKLLIVHYDGVAPKRYCDFFAMETARKDERGVLLQKTKESRASEPRIAQRLEPRCRVGELDATTVREVEAGKRSPTVGIREGDLQ